MPRQARPAVLPDFTSTSLQLHPNHYHGPSYGLLEPSSSPVEHSGSPTWSSSRLAGARRGSGATPLPPSAQAARRHLRKSSSLGKSFGRVVPAWSEVEAGFDELRDFGNEFGANIGFLGDKLRQTVPGVKGSVAFLSTLRSNIQLSSSLVPPSPYLHPLATPPVASFPSKSFIPAPSPTMSTFDSVLGDTADEIPRPDVPELVYETPRTSEARVEALQLIADSVAQKRQLVASTLLRSPPSVAFMLAASAVTFLSFYNTRSDLPLITTTSIGVLMAYLLAVRWLVSGYISQAEGITWAWLGDDELLIARFGDETIGAVAYRVVQESRSNNPSGTSTAATTTTTTGAAHRRAGRRRSSATRTALVRAWTVRRRQRGHGVGTALLEAAANVCVADRRCGGVVFADGALRAGAQRVLGSRVAALSGVEKMLAAQEERAEATLQQVVKRVGG